VELTASATVVQLRSRQGSARRGRPLRRAVRPVVDAGRRVVHRAGNRRPQSAGGNRQAGGDNRQQQGVLGRGGATLVTREGLEKLEKSAHIKLFQKKLSHWSTLISGGIDSRRITQEQLYYKLYQKQNNVLLINYK
jgi:hypothetical protein